MRIEYRIVEKKYEDRDADRWLAWGALYENCGEIAWDTAKILICAIPDEAKATFRYLHRRIRELDVGLEEAETLFVNYADYLRVRSEVETVAGETHREIRQKLWERLFVPAEDQPATVGDEPPLARPEEKRRYERQPVVAERREQYHTSEEENS